MLSDHKAKWCGARLETRGVNCAISATRCSRAVSGPGMWMTKISVLQNVSEAHSFKVHKLLCCLLGIDSDVIKVLPLLIFWGREIQKWTRTFTSAPCPPCFISIYLSLDYIPKKIIVSSQCFPPLCLFVIIFFQVELCLADGSLNTLPHLFFQNFSYATYSIGD